MEKALEGLGSADSSMENLRQTLDQLQNRASSVLVFTLQWNDIEEHFDSMRNTIEARAKEVQAQEESSRGRVLELEKKEERLSKVEATQKELDSIRKSIRERLKELEKKEKEFDSRQKEEIVRKEEEIHMIEKSSKQLEESVDEKFKEFEKKAKELVLIKKSTEDSLKELKMVEELVRKEREELAVNLKQLKSCTEEFEMRRKLFGEGSWDLKRKKADFQLEIKQKNEEFELTEKKLEERSKELELKEKELEARSKKPSSPQKSSRLEFEPLVSLLAKHVGFGAPMDENCSLIYLNESQTRGDDELFVNRADLALRILSLDPAKLVLDGIQGSYQPYLKKQGDGRLDGHVAIKSCVVLLEKLMKINPKIEPEVQKEATRLGIDWFDKVSTNPENEMEVLGCLLFLAVYGLVSGFNPQLVSKLLERVTLCDQAPKLFQLFRFKDKVSDVVHTLIGKEEYFAAIRFNCEFRLFTGYKAANLLRKYLRSSKKAAQRIVGTGNSPEVKRAVWEKQKADVVFALKYIKDKKSENIFPIKILEEEIDTLEKQPAAKNKTAPRRGYQGKRVHQSNEKCHSLSNDIGFSASVSAMDVTVSSEQLNRAKRQRTADPTDTLWTLDPCQNPTVNGCASGFVPSQVKISDSTENRQTKTTVLSSSSLTTEPKLNVPPSHMNGDTLGAPVDKHCAEETDLSDFLRCASDPAKLVLNTVMVLCPSKMEGELEFKLRVSPDRCFLVLNQLKNLSPQIEHSVKNEAKKLAISWKSKLSKNKSDLLEVVCFLQFLGIFKVVSEFKADELLALLDSAHWQTVSPDLCQFLGLTNEIPSFIQNLIKTRRPLKAIDYILALGMVERFPPVPILKDFLRYTNESAEKSVKDTEIVDSQVVALNKQIKALKDALKCISHHKLESHFNVDNLKEHIRLLFKQRSQLRCQFDGSKTENKPNSSNPQTQKAILDSTNTHIQKVIPGSSAMTNPDRINLQSQEIKPDPVISEIQRKDPDARNPQDPDSLNSQSQKIKLDSENPQNQMAMPDSTQKTKAAPTIIQNQKIKAALGNPQTHRKNPDSTNTQTQKEKADSIDHQFQMTKSDPTNTGIKKRNPDSKISQPRKTKTDSSYPQTRWKSPDSATPQNQKMEPVSDASAAASNLPEASSAGKPKPTDQGISAMSGAQHAKKRRGRRGRPWRNEQTSAHYRFSSSYDVASRTSNYRSYYPLDCYTSSSTWAVEDYNGGIPREHVSVYSYLYGREAPSGQSLHLYHPYNSYFWNNYQF